MTKVEALALKRKNWRLGSAKYRTQHQRQVKDYARTYNWRKLGLAFTLDDYNRIVVEQGGLCALCRRTAGARGFHVDHCHKTLKVRGLLCHTCNTGLGMFDDSILLFETAIQYLKERG